MSGRKESFWDGLGPEIYGVRPGFAEYSARAQHTFRSFHITPYSSLLEGGSADWRKPFKSAGPCTLAGRLGRA